MFGKSFIKTLLFKVLCVWTLVLAVGIPVQSVEFTVDTTADTVDANPGDGVAKDQNGSCSLRAAIMEANALVGPDTILLGPTAYQLTLTGAREDEGRTGDLDIFSNLTIQGAGTHQTIIDANGLDRALHIRGAWDVTIADLSIRNGRGPDAFWDDSISGFRSGGSGGGILCRNARLTIQRCSISQNQAGSGGQEIPDSGDAGNGGGMYCKGVELEMVDSAVSENLTGSGFGRYYYGLAGDGGGLYLVDCRAALRNCSVCLNRVGVQDGAFDTFGGGGGLYLLRGEIDLRNCTVSDNALELLQYGYGYGGGIYLDKTELTLRHCTVARNKINAAQGEGGGIYCYSWGMGTRLKSTIITENYAGQRPYAPDIYGQFESLGYNLVGDISDGGGTIGYAPGDLVGEPARLGPLVDNGGPTKTIALLPESAAIDAADPQEMEAADQRGVTRPQDGNHDRVAIPDIGAFEVCFPGIDIVAPANGSTVRGIVNVEAEAENAERVEFYVDGVLAETMTEPPFSFAWDTAAIANGTHSLTAVAVDIMEQSATDGIAVFLDNVMVRLEVERRTDRGWLVSRQVADLKVTVPNLSPSKVERVEVLRRWGDKQFEAIRELAVSDFENNCCRFYEVLPDPGLSATYRAVAVDAAGNVLGQSLEKNL